MAGRACLNSRGGLSFPKKLKKKTMILPSEKKVQESRCGSEGEIEAQRLLPESFTVRFPAISEAVRRMISDYALQAEESRRHGNLVLAGSYEAEIRKLIDEAQRLVGERA